MMLGVHTKKYQRVNPLAVPVEEMGTIFSRVNISTVSCLYRLVCGKIAVRVFAGGIFF